MKKVIDISIEKSEKYYEMLEYANADKFVDKIKEKKNSYSFSSDFVLGYYGTLSNLSSEQVVMAGALEKINSEIAYKHFTAVYMDYSDKEPLCRLCSTSGRDMSVGYHVNDHDGGSPALVVSFTGIEKPSDLIEVFKDGSEVKPEALAYTVTDIRKSFAKTYDYLNRNKSYLQIDVFDYMYETVKKADKIRETIPTEFVIPKKYGKYLDIVKSDSENVVSGNVILKSENVELPGLIGSRSDDENIYLSFARHSKDSLMSRVEKMKINTAEILDVFKRRMELIEEQKKEINKNLPKLSMENNQNKSNQRSALL